MRRSLAVVAFLALLCAGSAQAQRPRADVRRFQWDPVVVHVGVERPTGVEIYLTADGGHWALSWFPPDSVAAWLPSLDSLLEREDGGDAETRTVTGRGGNEMRFLVRTLEGRRMYGLRLTAPPFDQPIAAWLPIEYARDFAKALDRSVDEADKLWRKRDLVAGPRVYEAWEVDKQPEGAEFQRIGDVIPDYSLGGRVTLSFVVDTLGHIDPSTVAVYDCDDPRIAARFAKVVGGWPFTPGMRGGHPVPTRAIMSFTLESNMRMRVNPERILPGGH
ncbi:MAG TPA: hypothetical protein VFS44_15605 [Gemmatimonadaceae bacterium]|nr:hypothetical protein [Gemmatimonadaceae bacterium]